MEFCDQDISKYTMYFTARSFKLGQLIEDNEFIILENLKKSYYIFELLPFAKLANKNL